MGARSSRNTTQNNRSDGHLLEYFRKSFLRGGGGTNALPPSGLTATGGVISDYTSGPAVYRAHIFTSTGTFTVTAPGGYGDTVEYLVVAGGGGGGFEGGGGAGGFITNQSGHPLSTGNPSFTVTAGPTSYLITIGGGAASKVSPVSGDNGTDSYFGPPSTPTGITAKGGGGGGRFNTVAGSPGGSGGGGYSGGSAGGYGYNPSTPAPVLAAVPLPSPYGITQGNNGAPDAGGGGGAGGAGSPGPGGKGGIGSRTDIAGPNYPIGTPGPGGSGGYLAGGGSGAPSSPSPGESVGPDAGGGGYGYHTGFSNPLVNGQASTGGGGGGEWAGGNGLQGAGGSGIVVVRYQIVSLTATAKATGGLISFFGGKTIHTFTSSGTFATAPNWTSSPVEYVVVAGGGGGGNSNGYAGGGGGAGGYITGTTPIGAHPVSTTIQVGAGAATLTTPAQGGYGTPSYFGTPITSTGGGGGGYDVGPYSTAGNPGGSGGGNSSGSSGGPNAGTPGQGNPGGSGSAGGNPGGAGGGGGGAGGAGNSAPGPGNTPGGPGGIGSQLPATFQDPVSRVGASGPGGGNYWVAGGGGGGGAYNGSNTGGTGGGPGGPYAGAGNGSGRATAPATAASENTGSGGGGGTGPASPPTSPYGLSGGSGIVIIAYPS
jgi:hypothetical protein